MGAHIGSSRLLLGRTKVSHYCFVVNIFSLHARDYHKCMSKFLCKTLDKITVFFKGLFILLLVYECFPCMYIWRDGSVIKSTTCFSKGPEFNSQQPYGGSQPTVMRSGALFWPAGRVLRILHTHKHN